MNPPITIPWRITREYIQAHPELFFLYGNDYYNKGCLGQSWFANNEPNTQRIPTSIKMCANPDLFTDFFYDQGKTWIDAAINKATLLAHKYEDNTFKPIIPFPKIGCGHSRMRELAPKLWSYMNEEINKIAYPNIIRE